MTSTADSAPLGAAVLSSASNKTSMSFATDSLSFHKEEVTNRAIHVLPTEFGKDYDARLKESQTAPMNIIKTTKFDPRPWRINFLLYGLLFEIFQRRANIYFLLISLIQAIPGIITDGQFNTLGTFIFVVSIQIGQSVFEDYKRMKVDSEKNSSPVYVFDQKTNGWKQIQLRDIRVGDIIKVESTPFGTAVGDELLGSSAVSSSSGRGEIPCDCLLLCSSDPNGGCFIETSTLDGETRLKHRNAIEATCRGRPDTVLHSFHDIFLSVESPYPNIHAFQGSIIRHPASDSKTELSAVAQFGSHVASIPSFMSFDRASLDDGTPLDINEAQLLPFGALLRKTAWIVAIAVYVGPETKIMLNRHRPTWKRSGAERLMNKLLVGLLIFELALCIACATCDLALNPSKSTSWYIVGGPNGTRADDKTTAAALLRWVLSFLTFLVLFNNFIPISLYVTLELIRLGQSLLMEQDLLLYSSEKDKRLTVRTNALNEELGQVTHLLCDKTGTLTKNQMCFLKFSIGGRIFGKGKSELEKSCAIMNGKIGIGGEDNADDASQQFGSPLSSLRRSSTAGTFLETSSGSMDWSSGSLIQSYAEMSNAFRLEDPDLKNLRYSKLKEAPKIELLFSCLSLCHSVVAVGHTYEGDTPDESALCYAAAIFGWRYHGINGKQISIEKGTAGGMVFYDMLERFDFTAERKRSTVIVQELGSEMVRVITKGADEAMLPRLIDCPDKQGVADSASQLASEGLRVMVVAYKDIPLEQFEKWVGDVNAARTELTAITGSTASVGEAKQKLEDLVHQMESALIPIGCTGLDDRLQDNVAFTLHRFAEAGIKVWMVTGDHMHTAKKIGQATGLVPPGRPELLTFTPDKSFDQVVAEAEVWMAHSEEHLANTTPDSGAIPRPLVVIMDGKFILELQKACVTNAEGAKLLYSLLTKARSVIISRTSPKAKSAVVHVVRSFDPTAVTLGVGDGGNDVPMIQSTHVGIGMYGNEGHQAVNAADYGIAEFEHLERLLFVHGRANYTRITRVMNYFFYKNVLLVMTQFLYALFNSFSGRSFYEGLTVALYNVVFTSIPCIVLGVLDRDILNTDWTRRKPKLYHYSQKGEGLNAFEFFRWQLEGVAHACVCFFIYSYSWGRWGMLNNGRQLDEGILGLSVFAVIVMIGTARLAYAVRSWTMFHNIAFFSSISIGFIYYFAYGEIEPSISDRMYRVAISIGFKGEIWMYAFICFALCLLPAAFIWYGSYRLVSMNYMPLHRKVQLADSVDADAASRQPSENPAIGANNSREGNRQGGMTFLQALSSGQSKDESLIESVPAVGLLDDFSDAEKEMQFQKFLVGDLRRYVMALGVMTVVSLGVFLFTILTAKSLDSELEQPIAYGVLTGLGMCSTFIFAVFKKYARSFYHELILFVSVLGFSCISIANLDASRRDTETHPVFLAVAMLGLLVAIRPPLSHAFLYMFIGLVAYAGWYQAYRVGPWGTTAILTRVLEVALVAITGVIVEAFMEMFMRSVFLAVQNINKGIQLTEQEEARSFRLLCEVLPEKIVSEMRIRHRGLSEFSVFFKEASYLQSDIVKFTQFSSAHDPNVVIEVLNSMFTKFDRLASDLGVEKIKTIGDAYICVTGVPMPDDDHSKKIVYMGLALCSAIDDLNEEGTAQVKKPNLAIRVGVASGSVLGGVTGLQKVAYDVWGEAVDVAAKLEAEGLPQRVQCTKEMAENLQAIFSFDCINGKYFARSPIDVVTISSMDISPRDFVQTNETGSAATEVVVVPIDGVRSPEDGGLGIPLPAIDPSVLHPSDVALPVAAISPDDEDYDIFNDADEERQGLIEKWKGFTGETAWRWGLSFKDEHGETEFRTYMRHLAATRSETELLLGAAVFFLSACIGLSQFPTYRTHPFILTLYALSFVHLVLALVKHCSTMLRNDDDDEEKRLAQQGQPTRRLSRVRSSLRDDVLRRSATSSTLSMSLRLVTAATATIDQASIFSIRLSSVFAAFSMLVSYSLPLAFTPALPGPESSTVTVFIMIGSLTHLLTVLHVTFEWKAFFALTQWIGITFQVVWYHHDSWDPRRTTGDYVAMCVAYVFILYSAWGFEKIVRENFVAGKAMVVRTLQVESIRESSENLLFNVLPKVIVNQLIANPGKQLVQEFPNASVMFVYTNMELADMSDAVSVIKQMNSLLWSIDRNCASFKVEKIKTSPYLVVSGVPISAPNLRATAERICGCAQAILQTVNTHNKIYDTDFKVKIGIHSGKVCAGVLGTTKLQYDVFGDTVNMASRLTSSAAWDTIQLSGTAAELIGDRFTVVDLGAKALKGKGEQRVFRLVADSDSITSIKLGSGSVVISSEDMPNEPLQGSLAKKKRTPINLSMVSNPFRAPGRGRGNNSQSMVSMSMSMGSNHSGGGTAVLKKKPIGGAWEERPESSSNSVSRDGGQRKGESSMDSDPEGDELIAEASEVVPLQKMASVPAIGN
jgi:phospholipid-translocating P-type ATPase (flippase)